MEADVSIGALAQRSLCICGITESDSMATCIGQQNDVMLMVGQLDTIEKRMLKVSDFCNSRHHKQYPTVGVSLE
jgi:hypothetical protein